MCTVYVYTNVYWMVLSILEVVNVQVLKCTYIQCRFSCQITGECCPFNYSTSVGTCACE